MPGLYDLTELVAVFNNIKPGKILKTKIKLDFPDTSSFRQGGEGKKEVSIVFWCRESRVISK